MTYGHGWSQPSLSALRSEPRRALAGGASNDWRELGPDSRWALIEEALGGTAKAA